MVLCQEYSPRWGDCCAGVPARQEFEVTTHVPPPAASPVPGVETNNTSPTAKSDSNLPVVRSDLKQYRAKLREELAQLDNIRDEEISDRVKKGLDRNLVIAVVGAISIAFSVFFAVRSEAKGIADAGTKSMDQKLADHVELENAKFKLLEEKVKDLKDDTKDIKAQNAALLNRFGVKDPAREERDAGK